MDWRVKALIQSVCSNIPGGYQLNYLLQKFISKSLPPSPQTILSHGTMAKQHIEAIKKFGKLSLKGSVFYEFGAGVNLITPLIFYSLGVESQIIVDIKKLIRRDLVLDAIQKIESLSQELKVENKLSRNFDPRKDFLGQLDNYYSIRYLSPIDARKTGMTDEFIDCITTTNTLEHIPREDLKPILLECHRILKKTGIISFRVDYNDHYSYFDQNISPFNFLRFSDENWRKYSPPLQFQNRLRHCEYLEIYRSCGFEVIENAPARVQKDDMKTLSEVPLDEKFRKKSLEELAIRSSRVVLRK